MQDPQFRFMLTRDLLFGRGRICWVMLNPSTADAEKDDPTIRRVKAFSAREGFRFIEVVNLYPHRATKPEDLFELLALDESWHPKNSRYMHRAINRADRVVAAWGSWYGSNMHRLPPPTKAWTAAAKLRKSLYCLGETKDGAPKHPLYVRGDQPMEVFQ